MAELDQVWIELHDCESRVGRVEDQLIEIRTRAQVKADRRATLRWLIPTVICGLEAVAITLQTLGVL